jgi:hypothetical protein
MPALTQEPGYPQPRLEPVRLEVEDLMPIIQMLPLVIGVDFVRHAKQTDHEAQSQEYV